MVVPAVDRFNDPGFYERSLIEAIRRGEVLRSGCNRSVQEAGWFALKPLAPRA